ncbi:hypothetical protein [Polaromonas sp. AER18D-145]|uniref:hypothetical protein n=1 Tax=Polaromonas sp. AER18D-145 TaxID=1977060 RepID=UPI0011436A4E|nr:hypothetical protein [Polaromonas sp. AER18D-145]
MSLDLILEQAAHARPGYALATFKEAALPFFLLTARVLTLEKKALSPIEEGCLRAADSGLTSPEEICSFLGLPKTVLTSVLAALNARECISYIRATGDFSAKVAITAKGLGALSDAKIIVPQERIVKLVFDPFLKRLVHVPPGSLFKPREVKEIGWLEIPLCGSNRPEVEDIALPELDRVIARIRPHDEEKSELLALRRIERRELVFSPCLLLFYKAMQGNEVQIAFYQDDDFSVEHENAFRELDGPAQVGAKNVLAPAEVPDVSSVLENTDLKAALFDLNEIGELAADTAEQSWKTAKPIGKPPPKLRAMTQRLVRCHEHPGLLTKALTTSVKRLLVISPWITHQVVDRAFYTSLETLLRNGVDVHIGYGLADKVDAQGKDKARQKPTISPAAQQGLEDLQRRFSNFSLRFVGNTHRKHLVCDDKFAVVSSFNWLSFRGDPKQKARDELGFLVTEPDDVASLFNDGIELLNQGYDHPSPGRSGLEISRSRL